MAIPPRPEGRGTSPKIGMKTLVLSGANHGFSASAEVISDFLTQEADLSVTLTDDKNALMDLADYDVCVFGTGFTRAARQEDGTVAQLPELATEQEDALFQFVEQGSGLVGIHGTAWCIGGRAVDLIGGHANWHPPGDTFTVNVINRDHRITRDIPDFEVEDEIYMSAYDPEIQILATAEWSDKQHPLAWTKPYGNGRVFYTALGHGPSTFQNPTMQQLIANAIRWAGQTN